jgi:CheY-like chemotaxis protein
LNHGIAYVYIRSWPGLKRQRAPHPVILCIEDRLPSLTMRRMVLENAGYVVVTATSGRDALRRLADSHIDLVLSDHYLRSEMGTAIAAEIKKLRPEIPILLISGAQDVPETQDVDGVVYKADGPTKLLVLIAQALGL